VGAERELEAAAERNPLDRGDDRHRKLAPAPYRLLRKIRQPVRACRQIALLATGDTVAAALLHCGKTAHIEPGAEGAALSGQYHRAQALLAAEPVDGPDQAIEHRR